MRFTDVYAKRDGRLADGDLAVDEAALNGIERKLTMIQAKVPEGLPKWMSEHVDRYLKSGGKDGHMYTIKPPGMDKQITVAALLLVTKGRKSGEKYLFPLFYGDTGNGSYYIVASKGGAPDHPGWYKNILANPEVEVQVGTKTVKAKARTVVGRRARRSCGRAR